jgi:L-lysine exporter family protein LysE/ArgO
MNIFESIQGFIIGLSLIIAIGPQNLFVIRQGLRKSFVFIVCLICSLSDTILIIIGIGFSSYLSGISPLVIYILKIIGSIWLITYGFIKIKNSFKLKKIKVKNEIIQNVILTTLALTFLNPHVYLDTIILVGTIALNFQYKLSFGIGVVTSSFIFFFCLGYFSNYISKFIQNNKSWFWMDNIFGALMICYGLFFIITI